MLFLLPATWLVSCCLLVVSFKVLEAHVFLPVFPSVARLKYQLNGDTTRSVTAQTFLCAHSLFSCACQYLDWVMSPPQTQEQTHSRKCSWVCTSTFLLRQGLSLTSLSFPILSQPPALGSQVCTSRPGRDVSDFHCLYVFLSTVSSSHVSSLSPFRSVLCSQAGGRSPA